MRYRRHKKRKVIGRVGRGGKRVRNYYVSRGGIRL